MREEGPVVVPDPDFRLHDIGIVRTGMFVRGVFYNLQDELLKVGKWFGGNRKSNAGFTAAIDDSFVLDNVVIKSPFLQLNINLVEECTKGLPNRRVYRTSANRHGSCD